MDTEELISHIKSSKINTYVYHFTDEANLPSIWDHGLLSKEQMIKKGLHPQKTGGNEWSFELDKRKVVNGHDMRHYASLCMRYDHPMAWIAHKEGRLPNPLFLCINPDILKIEGTRIALGVANSLEAEILTVNEAIPRMDLEILYKWTDWSNHDNRERLQNVKKYEILIPNSVPRCFIVGRL